MSATAMAWRLGQPPEGYDFFFEGYLRIFTCPVCVVKEDFDPTVELTIYDNFDA